LRKKKPLHSVIMTTLQATVQELIKWATLNFVRPYRTSFHASALMYRGKLLRNPRGGIIASINEPGLCAERSLFRLCKRRYFEK